VKISIITVCYNSEKTIADSISSVNRQSYKDIEYIVVDGGSIDRTLDVVHATGERVTKIISEPDSGIYDAMNKGIALASGEVVGFINSDDYYASSDVLTKVVNIFRDRTVDACFGDLCYVRQFDTKSIIRYWRSSKFIRGSFANGWCPPHPTFFVRRNIYERFGCFDLSYRIAADVELMMRFLEVHQVRTKYLPEVLVKMRMGGTTNKNLINIAKQNFEILRALKQHALVTNPLFFFGKKIISRGRQFLTRPRLSTK
jgi:glycosyltransferase involved in cell wall biosynthesis